MVMARKHQWHWYTRDAAGGDSGISLKLQLIQASWRGWLWEGILSWRAFNDCGMPLLWLDGGAGALRGVHACWTGASTSCALPEKTIAARIYSALRHAAAWRCDAARDTAKRHVTDVPAEGDASTRGGLKMYGRWKEGVTL